MYYDDVILNLANLVRNFHSALEAELVEVRKGVSGAAALAPTPTLTPVTLTKTPAASRLVKPPAAAESAAGLVRKRDDEGEEDTHQAKLARRVCIRFFSFRQLFVV